MEELYGPQPGLSAAAKICLERHGVIPLTYSRGRPYRIYAMLRRVLEMDSGNDASSRAHRLLEFQKK
jgi:hypothetical protein